MLFKSANFFHNLPFVLGEYLVFEAFEHCSIPSIETTLELSHLDLCGVTLIVMTPNLELALKL